MLLWWWYAVKSKTEKEIFLPRRKYRNLIDTVPQDEQLKPSPSAAAPVDNITTAAAEESKSLFVVTPISLAESMKTMLGNDIMDQSMD